MNAPRIRVELRGGLGNQLFQAAAAYSLAKRIDARLQFEVSNFRSASLRGYALQPFAHGAEIFNSPRSLPYRALRQLAKLAPSGILKVAPDWDGIFEEQSYAYDARLETLQGDWFLRGYFQSWRYFNDCAAQIRQTFSPLIAASQAAKDYAANISPHSLSIHVRAGDFLKNPVANEVHGTLGRDYYQRAIKLARAARPCEQLLCFSDNTPFARDLLQGCGDITFVEGFSQHDDMFLMSCAQSHIIANSTYSYWSAWLDGRDDPFVVAPRAWLTERALRETYIGDLYPPDWIML